MELGLICRRLEKVWINQSHKPNQRDAIENAEEGRTGREESNASQLSLGDTHIWRENGDGDN